MSRRTPLLEILISTNHPKYFENGQLSWLEDNLARFQNRIRYRVCYQTENEVEVPRLQFGSIEFMKGLGLSRSRNRLLESAEGRFLAFADDDVSWKPEALLKLLEVLDRAKAPDVLTGEIETDESKPYKKYRAHSFRHGVLSCVRVSSIEIVVKRESIARSKIKFDEGFGLGAPVPGGEENIFVSDCVKAGLVCEFHPLVVAIHPGLSREAQIKTPQQWKTRRVVFKRMFGGFGTILFFVFLVKKVLLDSGHTFKWKWISEV